jgi:hypothetical protein
VVNPFYVTMVGSLRYLVHTRPDLAFAVGYVSRFMERPLDYGLHYKRAPGMARFIGYCDSDLVGDIDPSKSTSGVIAWSAGSPSGRRSWRCQVARQSTSLPPLQQHKPCSCPGCSGSFLVERLMW